MTTRQSIEYGESLLKEQRSTLEKIGYLQESKDDKKTLEFLLEYLRLDLEGRVAESERKLSGLRKKYEVEFEKASYEANSKMDSLIAAISEYIGKEPLTVTERIGPVVAAYKAEGAKTIKLLISNSWINIRAE